MPRHLFGGSQLDMLTRAVEESLASDVRPHWQRGTPVDWHASNKLVDSARMITLAGSLEGIAAKACYSIVLDGIEFVYEQVDSVQSRVVAVRAIGWMSVGDHA